MSLLDLLRFEGVLKLKSVIGHFWTNGRVLSLGGWRTIYKKKLQPTRRCTGGDIVEDEQVLGDFFVSGVNRPINVKEAEAVEKTLVSMSQKFKNQRVDVFVDNQVVISSWKRGGGRNLISIIY